MSEAGTTSSLAGLSPSPGFGSPACTGSAAAGGRAQLCSWAWRAPSAGGRGLARVRLHRTALCQHQLAGQHGAAPGRYQGVGYSLTRFGMGRCPCPGVSEECSWPAAPRCTAVLHRQSSGAVGSRAILPWSARVLRRLSARRGGSILQTSLFSTAAGRRGQHGPHPLLTIQEKGAALASQGHKGEH